MIFYKKKVAALTRATGQRTPLRHNKGRRWYTFCCKRMNVS